MPRVSQPGKTLSESLVLYKSPECSDHSSVSFAPPFSSTMLTEVDGSEHSASRDITVVSEAMLSEANSIVKEKYEISEPREVEIRQDATTDEGDYPDGGLRTWLIVCGVCDFSLTDLYDAQFTWASLLCKLGDVQHILNVSSMHQN